MVLIRHEMDDKYFIIVVISIVIITTIHLC